MDRTLKGYFNDLKLINEIEKEQENKLKLNLMYLNDIKNNLYENINLTMAFVLASIEMQHIQDKERVERIKRQQEEDLKVWFAYDWQNNFFGRYKSKQEAWKVLDQADMSGNVIHIDDIKYNENDDIFNSETGIFSSEEVADKIVNEIFDDIKNNKHPDNNNNKES